MKKSSSPSCSPRTAVAYARYSSAGQRDVSIEQQLADIRSFAQREGFTLVHEYADHARSGFKNASARTAFQSMMSAAESGSFDTVISWKVDRFGRNREESALFKGRLRRFGVKVLYAMEPIPEGSAGVLLEGMLEATAEWYSRQLSENVTRGMTDNAHRCLYNGTKILGYTRGPDGRYALNPDEAAVVRNIFDLYSSGFSAARICQQLNNQGVKTSRGCSWRPESLLRVISNERYTGVYIWGSIRVPDGMPAIIDQSTFEEAQRMKGKTARHVEQGAIDYLLTGKAFCGHCGAAMIGDSGTSKDGTRHYDYSCQSRKARKGCRKKSLQKDYLESRVIDFVLDFVLSDEHIEENADVIMALQAEEMKSSPLSAMDSEYSETKKKIQNINNAIAAGIWNSSTSAMLSELEASAESLRQSIEMMRFSQSQLLDRDRVIFFLHRFTKGDRNDPLFRRHIIETFINAVYVFDDHLDIVTNNREGNQRFPLSDLPADPAPDSGPECSDSVSSGVPNVSHPNTQVTIFRIAI
ncbi:MAG: recombinase family protein [Clostridia bacterium]|nr:recombinase family protein [Clostridia bacterium]